MGFFDFLFGSKKRTNVEVVPDHIWMTTHAKFTGLAKKAEERSRSDTVAILLVAHFLDVLARLEVIANQKVANLTRRLFRMTSADSGFWRNDFGPGRPDTRIDRDFAHKPLVSFLQCVQNFAVKMWFTERLRRDHRIRRTSTTPHGFRC